MKLNRNVCFPIILALCTVRCLGVGNFGQKCEVTVAPPWEITTFVPQGSFVHMSCNAIKAGQIPTWSIELNSSGRFIQFPIPILNLRGFYQYMDSEGIHLTINNTMDNNGTSIQCIDGALYDTPTILETNLHVYLPTTIAYLSQDIAKQSVNISWSPLPLVANKSYVMSVEDTKNYTESFLIHEPYSIFTAPEGAPPCEVYNFSVTATYYDVGATYTGPGCSVPSPVLSRMLPSLPDISSLESSLQYSLHRESNNGIKVRVTFMPANYCERYPVTDYSLEVVGPTSHSESDLVQSPSNGTLSVNNLLGNQVYSFNVVVSNSVGNVPTRNRTIYSTDVQVVRALPQEDNKSFLLQCNFLAGSNAQGCMVVLVGEFENITGNVTRDNKCTNHTAILNTTYPLSNYSTVFGYDIESDGSIGMLAVPGVIVRDPAPVPPCVLEELKPRRNQNIPTWIIIIIGVILGVALVTITVIMVFVVSCHLVRRSRIEKHSNYYHVSRPSPTSSAGPAPVTPPPAPIQDFTDEDDNIKKPQPIYDQPEKITIPKEEHTYHVLETSTSRYQFKRENFQHKPGNGLIPPHALDAQSPTHSESDSSPCDPPPVYQDIADVPLVRVRHGGTGRAGTSGQENHSSSTELPPVYHEITELQPSSRASSRLHDDIPSAGTNI